MQEPFLYALTALLAMLLPGMRPFGGRPDSLANSLGLSSGINNCTAVGLALSLSGIFTNGREAPYGSTALIRTFVHVHINQQ